MGKNEGPPGSITIEGVDQWGFPVGETINIDDGVTQTQYGTVTSVTVNRCPCELKIEYLPLPWHRRLWLTLRRWMWLAMGKKGVFRFNA